jgi:iron complex transport system ATP-binding protein
VSRTTLSLRNIEFAYEPTAWNLTVDALEFGRERITCIVGPNGSGKSTLLRIAAGILKPGSGSALLNAAPLADMNRRDAARSLGFLPQEEPSLFDYTVETIAQMGRYAHLRSVGLMTDTDAVAINSALDAVDMTHLRKRPLSRLSGGERRRALIASVLAQQPDILLLDEPTNSLDIHHAAAVMRILSRFDADGPAVVVVTHDINLASLFGQRLLLIVNGKIRADGAPEDVICESIMEQAYGNDFLVRKHPETGGPMVIPRRTPAQSDRGAES